MTDNPNDSALERRVAQLEELLRANPLTAGAFGEGGIEVHDGGRIAFLDGGGIIIDGDGTIDLQGAFILEGAQTVKPGGSITIEGAHPIKLHRNADGDALVEVGGGGVIGNDDGIVVKALTGQALVEVVPDSVSLTQGTRGLTINGFGISLAGVPQRAATSTDRALVINSAGQIASVPYSGGGGDGEPGEPGDPNAVFRWPFPKAAADPPYLGHSGIDWPRGMGTPVKSIGPGVVEDTWSFAGNTYASGDTSDPAWRGHCIMINHGVIGGHRISSLYAHLRDSPILGEGSVIAAGQTINYVGNTGYSSGPHLHHEIIFDGVRLPTGSGGYERAMAWLTANASGSWVG